MSIKWEKWENFPKLLGNDEMKERNHKKMWVTKVFFKNGTCLEYDPIEHDFYPGQVQYLLDVLNDDSLQFVRSQRIIINKKEVLYIDFEEIEVLDTDQ